MTAEAEGGALVVYSTAAPGRDDEFNRWYDDVHVPEVLALGPFRSAQRFVLTDPQPFAQTHRYVAVYAFDGDPQAALAALLDAAGDMTMSDAMQDAFMSLGTVISPLVAAT